MALVITTTVQEARNYAVAAGRNGQRIAFVPTMGALHAGHASLMQIAHDRGDRVVVSIFVNPTQFGPNEDFARYRRDFAADKAVCAANGAHMIFHPEAGEMYASDGSTVVCEERLSRTLCGRHRPGHFQGVTTIVAKLFGAVRPDVAVFGQKDAQQAVVIRRMTRDLNLPVEIVVGPIVREADGLAMSSRNTNLDEGTRRDAASMYRGLSACKAAFDARLEDVARLRQIVADEIASHCGEVEYIEFVDPADLTPITRFERPVLVAAAARFGGVRLIDNLILGGGSLFS